MVVSHAVSHVGVTCHTWARGMVPAKGWQAACTCEQVGGGHVVVLRVGDAGGTWWVISGCDGRAHGQAGRRQQEAGRQHAHVSKFGGGHVVV
jgi:hypothetical protein